MNNHQRHQHLLKLVSEHGQASVDQLVRWLGVSPSTVRRDIAFLVGSHLLVRRHKGVASGAAAPAPLAFPRAGIETSVNAFADRKRAIARQAARMCKDGESIIINGGSTTSMMPEFMTGTRMQVVTNSFQIAERLVRSSENEVVIRGGSISRKHDLVLSPFDSDVPQHDYDKMFLGVYGVSSMGLVEADLLLIRAVAQLLRRAREVIVLADSSKFDIRTGHLLCSLEQVACVITDTYVSDASIDMLERSGVRVVTVAPEGEGPQLRPARREH
jgi:DeoR family ulaG and ulaABCDEF operon transcriptional repressor